MVKRYNKLQGLVIVFMILLAIMLALSACDNGEDTTIEVTIKIGRASCRERVSVCV